MTGNKLKAFAGKLPKEESEALKALCEPNWDYEVLWTKKGPNGILMATAFYTAPHDIFPIYSNGEIRWLQDTDELPEDREILNEYRSIKALHEEEMKPYPWRWKLKFGTMKDPVTWLHYWLFEHDPDDVELSMEAWMEREQILKDLKWYNGMLGYADPVYESEIVKKRKRA